MEYDTHEQFEVNSVEQLKVVIGSESQNPF